MFTPGQESSLAIYTRHMPHLRPSKTRMSENMWVFVWSRMRLTITPPPQISDIMLLILCFNHRPDGWCIGLFLEFSAHAKYSPMSSFHSGMSALPRSRRQVFNVFRFYFSLRFPFYHELKIMFLLWLISSYGSGAKIMYKYFVQPEYVKREHVSLLFESTSLISVGLIQLILVSHELPRLVNNFNTFIKS